MTVYTFNLMRRAIKPNPPRMISKVQVVSIREITAYINQVNNVEKNEDALQPLMVLEFIVRNFNLTGNVFLKSPELDGLNGVFQFDNEHLAYCRKSHQSVSIIFISATLTQSILMQFLKPANEDNKENNLK